MAAQVVRRGYHLHVAKGARGWPSRLLNGLTKRTLPLQDGYEALRINGQRQHGRVKKPNDIGLCCQRFDQV